ncbi:hypothetical protein MKW98_013861 [Papaver atlanticum]|uniref:Uncharacterized protein n=1 Tax=Papaver atlanticum TaxID=357466 RepID=A0AAD4XRT8_9MAGN|nr:hypothetical protein MKW98_013861 [Papaver atlanticum]
MANDMVAAMKVEVVSKEIIKPSCPTPNHLKTFNLSHLDQLAPPFYTPLLLYYCSVIKKSLAEALTQFYPLAGKVIDDKFVDCNDDGANYFETKVSNCQLSQLIQHPDVHEVANIFLPFEPRDPEILSMQLPLISVKVNVFDEDCGGGILHSPLSSTIGTIARGISSVDADQQIKGPDFGLQCLFPQKDLTGFKPPASLPMNGVVVTKKFVFTDSKLALLKEKSQIIINESTDLQYQLPTRVEALSGLIWKWGYADPPAVTVYLLTHAINMRSRIVPPLPPHSFGNMACLAVAPHVYMNNSKDIEAKDQNYPDLVSKVRDSIKKIDGDYIEELRTTDMLLNFLKMNENKASGQSTSMLHFTSWCRFPIYDADFGWGKPTWISISSIPFKNMVVLMDTSSGDGIEATVSLDIEDAAAFEHQLLAFMS